MSTANPRAGAPSAGDDSTGNTTTGDGGARTFTFIGVTTTKSAIMRIFPAWAEHLGLGNVRMAGVDLAVHAPPERYREAVEVIRSGPLELGALVTTHKIDLFNACRDMFDFIDPYAELCGEVSSLSKRDGLFRAHAKDPISSGRALDEFIEPGYWTRGGAGGADADAGRADAGAGDADAGARRAGADAGGADARAGADAGGADARAGADAGDADAGAGADAGDADAGGADAGGAGGTGGAGGAGSRPEALLFGAGGSNLAITLYLMTGRPAPDRPRRIVVVNRSPARLESMRALHEKLAEQHEGLGEQVQVEYVHNADPVQNDRMMAEMPPGSLVVNGTGMGKDSPGSPITDHGAFPERARVWELNYRGELDFLHQARRQEAGRALFVEDGWRYFVHGWTCVIEEVFDIPMTPEVVGELSRIALGLRNT